MIRSTYALDGETVSRLDALARRWNVSKSEALRRAIRGAAESDGGNEALAALDKLQKSMQLREDAANAWEKRIRAERRANRPARG